MAGFVEFGTYRDGANGTEVFTKLAANFNLSDTVKEALIATKMDNLDEFRFFFDEETKVDAWVNSLRLGEEKGLQAARVRRAWFAVRLLYRNMEQDRSKVSASDLDTMLEENELRDAKAAFWRRYCLKFPPEVHPSVATLSRVSREMGKRMLCVFNIWKVRNLQYQLHTTNKRRKVGENLFTEDHEDDDSVAQSWESYLDKLYILMVAYSMAGTTALNTAPGTDPEGLGADSTKYVEVPLDVVMAYFFRAKRTAGQLPASQRLTWLQARDGEERSEWVAKFRDSTIPLGQVIKETMVAAHWLPTTAMLHPGCFWSSGCRSQDQPTVQSIPTWQAYQWKSRGFQHGQCKNKTPCALGQHRCGLVTKKERVCGAAGHGAASCKQTPKLA